MFFCLGCLLGVVTFFLAVQFLTKPQYNSIITVSTERAYLQNDIR